jgi:tripartite motif-containing protein 71
VTRTRVVAPLVALLGCLPAAAMTTAAAAVPPALTSPTHVTEITSPPPLDEVYPAGAAGGATWYVADSGQSRIVTATSAGFSGVLSGSGWQHPKALALDPSGNQVWVADTGHQRIAEVSIATGTTLLSIKAGINSPYGVAADTSRVYVANTYGKNVLAFDKQGTSLTWSTSSCGGKAFGRVRGLTTGSDGRIYATDTDNGRIVILDPATGACVGSFGSKGKRPGQYNGPWALTSDGSGGLWIADSGNYRVQHVTNAGQFIAATSSSFGSGPNQYAAVHCVFTSGNVLNVCDTDNHRIETYAVSANGTPTYTGTTAFASPSPAEFNQPVGISFADNGDFYVADSFNQRVVVCHASSNSCDTTIGGFGGAGGYFRYPRGLTVAGGALWVANSENQRVDSFTLTGQFQNMYKPAGTTLYRDYDVAVDPSDGSLWVTDTYHSRVVDYALDGTVLHAWSAGTTKPAGITVDPAGNVFVSDSGNNRLLKCSRSGTCQVLASAGTGPGQVKNPNGLAIVAGNLFVADSGNNRVEVLSASTGTFISTFGQGFLNSPRDVAVDPSGRFAYVSNFRLNSVSVWGL